MSEQIETHPEDTCEKCGGPNITWFAPSPIWNKYARSKGHDIICPICLAKLAEESGFDPTAWVLLPEEDLDRLRATQPRILTPPFKVDQLPKVGDLIMVQMQTGTVKGGIVWKMDNFEIAFRDAGYVFYDSISKIIILPDDLLDGRRDA